MKSIISSVKSKFIKIKSGGYIPKSSVLKVLFFVLSALLIALVPGSILLVVLGWGGIKVFRALDACLRSLFGDIDEDDKQSGTDKEKDKD